MSTINQEGHFASGWHVDKHNSPRKERFQGLEEYSYLPITFNSLMTSTQKVKVESDLA